MISPRSIDMNKSLLQTLFPKLKLLNHSKAGSIFRSDIYLHAVKSERVKKVVNGQRNRVSSDVSARICLGNPVADGGGGDRSVQDVGNV